ncbi:hypothetical protein ACLOJK_017599 [Asimina triloba]
METAKTRSKKKFPNFYRQYSNRRRRFKSLKALPLQGGRNSFRQAKMLHLLISLVIFLIFSAASLPNAVNALGVEGIIDSPYLTSKVGTNRTIKVDAGGGEDFTSVQEAINSVPDGNSEWIIIHIRKGVYREKIHIPERKTYIFLRGNGKGKTKIVWNTASGDNAASATLTVSAPHFLAWGISFKNEAQVADGIDTPENRTVAAYVKADMVAFYHCGFFSQHNTLFDARGRHYYENCYITGSIDFIFGKGRSIFKRCEIFVVADKRTKIMGSITAQNRGSEDDDGGFVFVKGKVYGIGNVYLGRARTAYSRVIFSETYLSKTIFPEGWTNWSFDETTEHLSLWEEECYGPGANTTNRVPWSKQRSEDQVRHYVTIDFIDGKNWLPVY